MEDEMTRPQGDETRMRPEDGETPAQRLRRSALEHAGKALDTIVEIMNSEKASTGDRLRAAITVIERAYGKQDGAESGGNKADMLEDIREELARLRRGEAAFAPDGGDAQAGPCDAAAIIRSDTQTGLCGAAAITRRDTEAGGTGEREQSGEEARKP